MTRQAHAARTRWLAYGLSIPRETECPRMLIKREIYTREITITDLANRLGMSVDHVSRTLDPRLCLTITPGFLARVITHLHITPVVARRLHLIAAREQGWQV